MVIISTAVSFNKTTGEPGGAVGFGLLLVDGAAVAACCFSAISILLNADET